MFLFERILAAIRAWVWRRRQPNFDLDMDTTQALRRIARREQRSPAELANRIVEDTLRAQGNIEASWACWERLTPRQQQVTALICLGYTSREIAARLSISPQTVKTHVEHIFEKFGVSDRVALRLNLAAWDFRDWDV